jgi:hypothetical protein
MSNALSNAPNWLISIAVLVSLVVLLTLDAMIRARRSRRRRPPDVSCSFCGRAASSAAKLIQGPGVGICDRCVGACRERACSFCRKSASEVRLLMTSSDYAICDECIDICRDIFADDAQRSPGSAT